jgi:hypothetical protein
LKHPAWFFDCFVQKFSPSNMLSFGHFLFLVSSLFKCDFSLEKRGNAFLSGPGHLVDRAVKGARISR